MRTDNAETGVGWTSDNQLKSNVVGANHSGSHYSVAILSGDGGLWTLLYALSKAEDVLKIDPLDTSFYISYV